MTPRELLARYTSTGQISSFFVDQMGIYTAKQYGAKGDGATDDYTAINNMVTAVTTAGTGTIYFPAGNYVIGTNLTFPTGAEIWFARGAVLQPKSGVTVAIKGTVTAPISRIFGGSGTVTFSAGIQRGFYPQWWGAVADGSTDDTTAMKACAVAAGAVGGTILLPAPAQAVNVGTAAYKITEQIDTTGSSGIIGTNNGDQYSSCSAILCSGASAGIIHQSTNATFRNLSFVGDTVSASQTGLHLAMVNASTNGGLLRVEDCYFKDFNSSGAIALLMDEGTGTALLTDGWVENCHFTHNNIAIKAPKIAGTFFVACRVHSGGTPGTGGSTNGAVIIGDNTTDQADEINIFFVGCDLQSAYSSGVQVYAAGVQFLGGQITDSNGLTIESGGNAQLVGCMVSSGVLTNSGGNFGNTPVIYGGSARIWTELPITTLTGTTSGTVDWIMDEQGTHKRFIANLKSYENTTGTAQTISFPRGFNNTPTILGNTSPSCSVSTSTFTLPSSMGATLSGQVIVEGM